MPNMHAYHQILYLLHMYAIADLRESTSTAHMLEYSISAPGT